jgi:hypothetical protein
LRSEKEHIVFRCVSPVGRVHPKDAENTIAESVTKSCIRLGAVVSRDDRSYDLTVEEDVLLGIRETDALRVGMLLARVATQADILEQIHLPGHDQPLDCPLPRNVQQKQRINT